MSILIKGMDMMPETCSECLLVIRDSKTHAPLTCSLWRKFFINTIDPYRNRLIECPLVEISTPHGQLIDADALGIGKAKREVFDVPEYADGWNSAVKLIYDAPTVIESEE